MEGVQSEAASLAGHLQLGKLIVLYDDNGTTIDGPTSLAFSEDVVARYGAYGWHTQRVEDGTDLVAIDTAIEHAVVEENRPSLIAVRTIIGYGNPKREGTAKAHSDPFGAEEVRLTKENLGWPLEPKFLIPEPVLAHMRQTIDHGEEAQERWKADFQVLKAEWPGLAQSFERARARALPDGWTDLLPRYSPADKPMATREASGKVLNAIASELPELIGGSADLTPSNKTRIEDSADFEADSPQGRNLRFGVREHAMGAILNGIAAHGGLRPYGGTFLVFSDYMRPSIRLAALMKQPVIYVFTHDSVGLGEDGPTHQPVEHLASLRAIPNLAVIRPADPAETAVAWRAALERTDGPTALALTRQKVPHLPRGAEAGGSGDDRGDRRTGGSAERLLRGGYVLAELPDSKGLPDVILIGTGSEVQLALEAARRLADEDGVQARVVSLPSWELFERQSAGYRDRVLPPAVAARVSVEAGRPLGWERYVGPEGAIIGLERFGASAPGEVALQKLGFNLENVVERARRVLAAREKASGTSRGGPGKPSAGRHAPTGETGPAKSAGRSPGATREAERKQGRRADSRAMGSGRKTGGGAGGERSEGRRA
jgi:transketolase